MAARRDIAPFLQRVRAFLLGREYNQALRFEDGLAERTQPPPDIPGGPAHKLSANYYCNRDPRREVEPPLVIATSQGTIGKGSSDSKSQLPTPGKVYLWD